VKVSVKDEAAAMATWEKSRSGAGELPAILRTPPRSEKEYVVASHRAGAVVLKLQFVNPA
jgi:hypothetical protein